MTSVIVSFADCDCEDELPSKDTPDEPLFPRREETANAHADKKATKANAVVKVVVFIFASSFFASSSSLLMLLLFASWIKGTRSPECENVDTGETICTARGLNNLSNQVRDDGKKTTREGGKRL